MIDIDRTLLLLDVEAESNFVQAEAIDAINFLREENARLQEALKPFAGMAQHCEGMSDSESQCVFVGDLRAARAAIREGGEK